ncbi:GIY-YIG nuclease family protein [Chelatococcus sp. YT9]|uniref:GIY-YIG nuclease family protein n=1 Tax=Chelatococcus sp. YT9 TaxID=2835635 RepID=UPI001BCC08A1|nr:GIY-YIG nuclease family protein [Chelatococcus sp. YT9]MBS7699081.1 GIY-YIG nuclease family protein [Chelatococcus sp. YT9]
MNREERKAHIAAYKERKTVAGIYAGECTATGAHWVGRAPDLSTIRNRLEFTLGQGLHRHAGLQAAWHTHGLDAFRLKTLETIDEDLPSYVAERLLGDRLAYWCAELKAARL